MTNLLTTARLLLNRAQHARRSPYPPLSATTQQDIAQLRRRRPLESQMFQVARLTLRLKRAVIRLQDEIERVHRDTP